MMMNFAWYLNKGSCFKNNQEQVSEMALEKHLKKDFLKVN